MKKVLLLLVVVSIIVLGAAYIMLPSTVQISHAAVVGANSSSIYRSLGNPQVIHKWLSQSGSSGSPAGTVSIQQGAYRFTFRPVAFNTIEVQIDGGQKEINSFITILPFQEDSSLISWKTKWPAGRNPVRKIQESSRASEAKKEITQLWNRLLDFLKKEENIYGLTIQRALVTDTLLLTRKLSSATYPTPEAYYAMIREIKDYMQDKGVSETNFPMLHISKGKDVYETIVAVPINKPVAGSSKIELKKMVKGNLLTAEVKGGAETIDESFQQMEFYMLEKRLLSPAIPYQSLITDRLLEKDTSKWVTRLNYPVL